MWVVVVPVMAYSLRDKVGLAVPVQERFDLVRSPVLHRRRELVRRELGRSLETVGGCRGATGDLRQAGRRSGLGTGNGGQGGCLGIDLGRGCRRLVAAGIALEGVEKLDHLLGIALLDDVLAGRALVARLRGQPF